MTSTEATTSVHPAGRDSGPSPRGLGASLVVATPHRWRRPDRLPSVALDGARRAVPRDGAGSAAVRGVAGWSDGVGHVVAPFLVWATVRPLPLVMGESEDNVTLGADVAATALQPGGENGERRSDAGRRGSGGAAPVASARHVLPLYYCYGGRVTRRRPAASSFPDRLRAKVAN